MSKPIENSFESYFRLLSQIVFCNRSQKSELSYLKTAFLVISAPFGVPIMGILWGASSLIGRAYQAPESSSTEEKTKRATDPIFSKKPADKPEVDSLSVLSSSDDEGESLDEGMSKSDASSSASSSGEKILEVKKEVKKKVYKSPSSSFGPTTDDIRSLQTKGPKKEQINFLIEKAAEFCHTCHSWTQKELMGFFFKYFQEDSFLENPKVDAESLHKNFSAYVESAFVWERCEKYNPLKRVEDGYHQQAILFFEKYLPLGKPFKGPLTKDQWEFLSVAAKDFVNGLDEGKREAALEQIQKDIEHPSFQKNPMKALATWVKESKLTPAQAEELSESLEFLCQFFYSNDSALNPLQNFQESEGSASRANAAEAAQDIFSSLHGYGPHSEQMNFWITEARTFCEEQQGSQRSSLVALFICHFKDNSSFAKDPRSYIEGLYKAIDSRDPEIGELASRFYEQRLPPRAERRDLLQGNAIAIPLLEGQKRCLAAAAKDCVMGFPEDEQQMVEDGINSLINDKDFQENPHKILHQWRMANVRSNSFNGSDRRRRTILHISLRLLTSFLYKH